jgi:hypothetical protein
MSDANKEADDLAESNANSLLALCPSELGPVARNEFIRVVAELRKLKLAKPLDLALVALYSYAYAGWLASGGRGDRRVRTGCKIRVGLSEPIALCDARQSIRCDADAVWHGTLPVAGQPDQKPSRAEIVSLGEFRWKSREVIDDNEERSGSRPKPIARSYAFRTENWTAPCTLRGFR